MPHIDLRSLATRESGQIEWKENVADELDVVESIAAFANDFSNLGGGYVVCGAREVRDAAGFQTVEFTGLSADRFRRVLSRVLDLCRDFVDPPYVPQVEEVVVGDGDRRVLVFIAPRSPYAHTFRRKTDSGKFYIRQENRTIEARNGLMRELLVTKGAAEPWDRRVQHGANLDDLDLIAVRDVFERLGVRVTDRGLEDALLNRPHPLAPELCARVPLTGEIRPRRFALLLFGRGVQRFFPGAFTVFAQYAGVDRSELVAERHDLAGNLLQQADRLLGLLNAEAYSVTDTRPGAERANLVKYPVRALHEAAVNALAHRDYALDAPTRVTVFEDRVEIWSPGGLLSAVDAAAFLRGEARPRWRNQALAWYFERLNLAQGLGQGIPTILRTMRAEGCPDPQFALTSESVEAVLPAHPRHALFKTVKLAERELVYGRAEEALARIEPLVEQDPFDYRLLELFCDAAFAIGRPAVVKSFAQRHLASLEQFPASGQVALAEALVRLTDDAEAQALAHRLFRAAAAASLEEVKLRKLLVGVLDLGDGELALNAIDRVLTRDPGITSVAALRQLRARALASIGWAIVRNMPTLPTTRRGRAWSEVRRLIAEARVDLEVARAGAADAVLIAACARTAEDLARLDTRATRPSRRPTESPSPKTPKEPA